MALCTELNRTECIVHARYFEQIPRSTREHKIHYFPEHVLLLIPRLTDRQPLVLTLALLVNLRDFAEFVSTWLTHGAFIALHVEALGSVPIYNNKQVRPSAPEE